MVICDDCALQKYFFFLRGQMKLKLAGSEQGASCYWQYKGHGGTPNVSVICHLNIHWPLGDEFVLKFFAWDCCF